MSPHQRVSIKQTGTIRLRYVARVRPTVPPAHRCPRAPLRVDCTRVRGYALPLVPGSARVCGLCMHVPKQRPDGVVPVVPDLPHVSYIRTPRPYSLVPPASKVRLRKFGGGDPPAVRIDDFRHVGWISGIDVKHHGPGDAVPWCTRASPSHFF